MNNYQMYNTAPPRRQLRVQLANREHGMFKSLMSQVDPSGSERIEGGDAVPFLKKSGLDQQLLKQIWDIATPNGESFLDRQRFYIVLRLVALAQAGKPVSEDSIVNNVEAPLPNFGFSLESHIKIQVEDDPAETARWEITPEESQMYEQIFKRVAPEGDTVSGGQVRQLFATPEVSTQDLGKIWQLTDVDDKGFLYKKQFFVAVHLFYRLRKNNMMVPYSLPNVLEKMVKEAAPVVQAAPAADPLGGLGGMGMGDMGMGGMGMGGMPPPQPPAPVVKQDLSSQLGDIGLIGSEPQMVPMGGIGMGMDPPVVPISSSVSVMPPMSSPAVPSPILTSSQPPAPMQPAMNDFADFGQPAQPAAPQQSNQIPELMPMEPIQAPVRDKPQQAAAPVNIANDNKELDGLKKDNELFAQKLASLCQELEGLQKESADVREQIAFARSKQQSIVSEILLKTKNFAPCVSEIKRAVDSSTSAAAAPSNMNMGFADFK